MKQLKSHFARYSNILMKRGIPFPFISDRGIPSVSLTLLMISFTLWCLAAINYLPGLDLNKLENMVMICCGLYFSRKMTKGPKSTIQGEEESATEQSPDKQ